MIRILLVFIFYSCHFHRTSHLTYHVELLVIFTQIKYFFI